jgi:ankyrin repeat protein
MLTGLAAVVAWHVLMRPPSLGRAPGLRASPLPELLAAAERDDLAGVDRLLKSGADPNVRAEGLSALHYAVMADSRQIIERLLAERVDVDAPDRLGPALYKSVVFGKYKAFDVLLEYGAEPNQTWMGATALTQLLSNRGSAKFVRMLIDYGADPNLVGLDKRTPLETAAYLGSPESIDVLLAMGTRCGPAEGWKSLSYAVEANRLDNIDCLIRHGVDPNGKGPYALTVFQQFVGDVYRVETVKHLVDVGADPELPLADGKTPIQIAKMRNNWEMIDFLTRYHEKRTKRSE